MFWMRGGLFGVGLGVGFMFGVVFLTDVGFEFWLFLSIWISVSLCGL